MVGRALLDALRFGAPGGMLTAWAPVWISPSRPGEVNVMTESLAAILLSTIVGALIGAIVAYPALLLAAMAADIRGKLVGVATASLVTLGGTLMLSGGVVPSGPWIALPIVVAAYGAAVAWLRTPHILGRT